MKTTKGQIKKLREYRVGAGWLVIKKSEQEISEIAVYVGKDNVLRRVGNGRPLLPITLFDDGEVFEIEGAT